MPVGLGVPASSICVYSDSVLICKIPPSPFAILLVEGGGNEKDGTVCLKEKQRQENLAAKIDLYSSFFE